MSNRIIAMRAPVRHMIPKMGANVWGSLNRTYLSAATAMSLEEKF